MQSDLQRRFIIFAVVMAAALALLAPNIPSFKESLPEKWPSKPLSLGLDLSGGVHLVYRVRGEEAVKSRLQSLGQAVKSDMRDEGVALPFVEATDDMKLSLTLHDAVSVDQLRAKIASDYRDLSFESQRDVNGKPVLTFAFSPQVAEDIKKQASEQAVETLRNRVDQFGVSEPLIQKSGGDRIVLQMPGVSNVEQVKQIVGKVARLEFRLVPLAGTNTGRPSTTLRDRSGVDVKVENDLLMGGEAIDKATVGTNAGEVDVSLKLTSDGAKTFKRITTDNVGRQLAIILDNTVYSAPVIREPIGGGTASISGGFTFDEAQLLVKILRAGALPAGLDVVEERTVGPTLGANSIRSGVMAILMGLAAIVVFISFYYKKAGLLAVSSLILNLLLVLAALSGLGATLTLPGLAGLALTIGMAVDSNVIIFERIKDEIRNGSGRDAAVEAGFDKALSAIFDSNLSTLFTAFVLYYFGSGPIRGFAVTLSIGIATTMFCAVFVSKLIFDWLPLTRKTGELSI